MLQPDMRPIFQHGSSTKLGSPNKCKHSRMRTQRLQTTGIKPCVCLWEREREIEMPWKNTSQQNNQLKRLLSRWRFNGAAVSFSSSYTWIHGWVTLHRVLYVQPQCKMKHVVKWRLYRSGLPNPRSVGQYQSIGHLVADRSGTQWKKNVPHFY